MKYKFLVSPDFERQYKRLKKKYPSLPDDLRKFQNCFDSLDYADLGKKIRKYRLSIKSKGGGKRGGGRLITFELLVQGDISEFLLVTIYDKSEMDNVRDEYVRQVVLDFVKSH